MNQVGGVHVSCMPACRKTFPLWARVLARGKGRGAFPRGAGRGAFRYTDGEKFFFKILHFVLTISHICGSIRYPRIEGNTLLQ